MWKEEKKLWGLGNRGQEGRRSPWRQSDAVLVDSHLVETSGDVVAKQREMLKSSDYKMEMGLTCPSSGTKLA